MLGTSLGGNVVLDGLETGLDGSSVLDVEENTSDVGLVGESVGVNLENDGEAELLSGGSALIDGSGHNSGAD